jgi:hypothetical protein
LISLGAELATARLPPLTPEAMNVDLLPLFRRRFKLDEAAECVRASEVLGSSQPVEQPGGCRVLLDVRRVPKVGAEPEKGLIVNAAPSVPQVRSS